MMARRVSILLTLLCVAVAMAVMVPMAMASDGQTKESSWTDWAKKTFSGFNKDDAKKEAEEAMNKAGNVDEKTKEEAKKDAEEAMNKAGNVDEKTKEEAMKGAEDMVNKAKAAAKNAEKGQHGS